MKTFAYGRIGVVAILAAAALEATSARADVRLAAIFSDNMVLQQGRSVPIWGWADDGEEVTIQFLDQKVASIAQGGKWMARLAPIKAGGPHTLKVSGKNSIDLKNVLVGEVWVASGQSNMEWPLRMSYQVEQDIMDSANTNLRLFTVPKLKANEPAADVKSSWKECNPQNVPGFSAVAYYFARDLQKALGVPVGLIHTSWGGSPVEVWISHPVLETSAEFKPAILEVHEAKFKSYQDNLAKHMAQAEKLKAEGKPPGNPPGAPWKPAELYNGMIAPIIPYAIQGAIWYQGESNAGRAEQYRRLFPAMITNWRQDWGQGDFTFLTVQLAPFTRIKTEPGESNWAELREAQNMSTKVLPNSGVAVITDVGEENDIHPRRKAPVGARLALAARSIAYGEKIIASGPAYRSLAIDGSKAIIHFDSVGQGLVARDGELKGFSIAGADRKFVWAKADIQGDKVVVSSPQVPSPVAVRYGWADFPVVNLWNKDGLPASPFRTDDFPMFTAGRK